MWKQHRKTFSGVYQYYFLFWNWLCEGIEFSFWSSNWNFGGSAIANELRVLLGLSKGKTSRMKSAIATSEKHFKVTMNKHPCIEQSILNLLNNSLTFWMLNIYQYTIYFRNKVWNTYKHTHLSLENWNCICLSLHRMIKQVVF